MDVVSISMSSYFTTFIVITRLYSLNTFPLSHTSYFSHLTFITIGVRLCQGRVRETRYEANDETDTLEVTSDMILEGES